MQLLKPLSSRAAVQQPNLSPSCCGRRRSSRTVVRFTPVPHPSHLEDELTEMQRKLRDTPSIAAKQRMGSRPALVEHKQHGQHHWFMMQEANDAEQLERAAKHLLNCLLPCPQHSHRHSTGSSSSSSASESTSSSNCTLSCKPRQCQQLFALLCLVQDRLATVSPRHVLTMQPPLPETGSSSHRHCTQHHPQQHHHHYSASRDMAVQVQLSQLQHLPSLQAAAAHLGPAGNPAGRRRSSASTASSSSSSSSSCTPSTSQQSMDGTAGPHTPNSSSSSTFASVLQPHPSYPGLFAQRSADCLPCIPVGTCSDPHAVAAQLCHGLLGTWPTVLAVSAVPAAHEVLLEALTRTRRHLAATAADVDLLALVWPLRGHIHLEQTTAAAEASAVAAAAGTSAPSPSTAMDGLVPPVPLSSARQAGAAGVSSERWSMAAHSQHAEDALQHTTWLEWQQTAGAAAHGMQKDLGVLVLPWWGTAS